MATNIDFVKNCIDNNNLREPGFQEALIDMRLYAIRGYSVYATEAEVIPLMDKFSSLLEKLTDYRQYEYLRSEFGLPYLVKQYNYDCFRKTMEQLRKQYENLPDGLKGYFTLDENGIQVSLLPYEIIHRKFRSVFPEPKNL